MFYVYVLKSARNGDVYIGYTRDLRNRVKQHNSGEVRASTVNKPWTLVYYESYRMERDATKREKQLKNHKAKTDLKEQLICSLQE